ncbi:MAG TPA: TetR/AcrR family transcriptional regulator [Buttiauxella sp.]|jgi:AcrR family transcriptional regulator
MTLAHHRPKAPEQLRQTLLNCAAQIIAAEGLGGLTLDKVVKGTGISKGGLQHHFPSKDELINAVFIDLQQQLIDEVNAGMALDPNPEGSATRAYLNACGRMMPDEEQAINRALIAAMLADPSLRDSWALFINNALPQDDAEPEFAEQLLLCRLAADGLWFATLCGYHNITDVQRQALLARLLNLTEKLK